ncbi:MAG: hypothetical protein H2040_00360 [Euryhalocaulis sp.]|uniref:hypothetical protein n=1 Tax=Euryhalocaulis sp. TaxID=2744307 RepID=UPI0017BA2303|nr:hypothetical protein [Euryhalocaulis sp.]MBA4800292.1 hypothetical protein [Euryhalocaulis sp.]
MPKKSKQTRTVAEAMKQVQRAAADRKRVREKHEAEVAARVPGEGYEPCIVSFIDVLGFRDLLTTRHAHDIRDTLLQLREFTAPSELTGLRRIKDARLSSRAFVDSVSDAVVRVRVFETEYNDGAFFHELLDLLHAQVQCVAYGVVIRAGLTIGDAHVGLGGEGPVFGPAMVRAFEIETHEAIYPRVVIDESAYQRFRSDPRLHKEDHDVEEEANYVDRLLRLDADGSRFIDYLSASESEFDDPPSYFMFLEQHAKLIREKLTTTRGRARKKFMWLADYHNMVITEILAKFEDGQRSAETFEAEWEADPMTFLRAIIVESHRSFLQLSLRFIKLNSYALWRRCKLLLK